MVFLSKTEVPGPNLIKHVSIHKKKLSTEISCWAEKGTCQYSIKFTLLRLCTTNFFLSKNICSAVCFALCLPDGQLACVRHTPSTRQSQGAEQSGPIGAFGSHRHRPVSGSHGPSRHSHSPKQFCPNLPGGQGSWQAPPVQPLVHSHLRVFTLQVAPFAHSTGQMSVQFLRALEGMQRVQSSPVKSKQFKPDKLF